MRISDWSSDVCSSDLLQLVLPARKEVVDNAALGALRDAVQTAIYRTIGSEGSHSLTFQNWQRAADLGIELPEASPGLYARRPCTADNRGGPEGDRIAAGPLIMKTEERREGKKGGVKG